MDKAVFSCKSKCSATDDVEAQKILNRFSDKQHISAWAQTEIAAAIKTGLAKGIKQDLFAPKGNATRAQAATAIYNLYGVLTK